MRPSAVSQNNFGFIEFSSIDAVERCLEYQEEGNTIVVAGNDVHVERRRERRPGDSSTRGRGRGRGGSGVDHGERRRPGGGRGGRGGGSALRGRVRD